MRTRHLLWASNGLLTVDDPTPAEPAELGAPGHDVEGSLVEPTDGADDRDRRGSQLATDDGPASPEPSRDPSR